MPKRNFSISIGLVLAVLAGGAVGGALAGGLGPRPVSDGTRVAPLAQVPLLDLPVVDKQQAARLDAERAARGEPDRFAEPRQVDLSPDNSGVWEDLEGTGRLWRLRVGCPGALSLNLGFARYQVPSGAVLRIFASDGSGPVLVFDHRDNRIHGQLWTPVLLTSELVVEFQVPTGAENDWLLRLETIGCGYRFFGEDAPDKAGACNVDVVCPEGDGWRDQIATVGVYTVNGYWTCTGAMINNTQQDQKPLFLTAHHCDVLPELASTVVVYWNFQSPVCGQQSGGSLTQFSSGSTLRATYSVSDFALLELDESPDPAFGVNFAGWDRTVAVPDQAVAIHHPQADEKSISFENDPLTVTTYLDTMVPGDGTHFRVEDWDVGTTEVGSSGSPLFDAQQRIVGQLHGGYAACNNDLSDWYGRLSHSWTGGGTAASRLSNWLDPQGLTCTAMPLLDPQSGSVEPGIGCDAPPADNANIRITAMTPNPFLNLLSVTVELDRDAVTTVRIFDVRGQLAADLGGGLLTQGENNFSWDGYAPDHSRVPAGVYFLVIDSDGKTVKRRFLRLN